MFFSASLFALVASSLVSAGPVRITRRSADLTVFQFADVLEQLESKFYAQALSKFQDSDFSSAGFSSILVPQQQFAIIAQDESTHDTVLQNAITALGGSPITSCSFDFSSVLTDVATMAATARLVENVGVGAYLGGAALISDPQLLNAAATILTVEARHQTMLNILNSGSAIPTPFDLALTPPEVLAIAGGFISGCDVGIQANPALTITNTGTVTTGTQLQFSSPSLNGSMDGMFCQMLQGGMTFSISLDANNCVVPAGINGPVAIYITSDDQPILADVVVRSNSSTVAGPTMAFIDISPEAIGQLVRTTSTSSAEDSSVTTSVSASQASQIASSGSSVSSNGTSTGTSESDSSSSDSSSGSSSTATSTASASASSGSAAGTSAVADTSSTQNDDVTVPGGPNHFTGSADNGAVTVLGWTNLPPGM